jgi:hypothetical protein
VKFIEVKTTAGDRSTDLFASSNEISFSENHPDDYVLYRVYEFDEKSNTAECFQVTGPLSANFSHTPIQFKLRWSNKDEK